MKNHGKLYTSTTEKMQMEGQMAALVWQTASSLIQ